MECLTGTMASLCHVGWRVLAALADFCKTAHRRRHTGHMTSTRAARGAYANGRRTRQAIIDAAIDHFARFGYRGAPLASIAKSVNVTRSGLLHHFASKEELLVAALLRRDAMGNESLDEYGDATASSLSALLGLLRNEHLHSRGLVQLFTALVGESVYPDHPAHAHLRERYAATRIKWKDQLAKDQKNGQLPAEVDLERAATLLVAVMDGLQVQWLYDESIDIMGIFESFLEFVPRITAQGIEKGTRT